MSAPPSLLVRFGEFQLDEGDARLTRDGAALELQPKAFAVLCTLLRTPGQLVLKEALLDAVWGHRHVSESVLKTTVSQLRNVLADDAKQPRYIETAARRGYRFIAPLAGTTAPAPPPVPLAAPAQAPRDDAPGIVARSAPLALLEQALAAAQRGTRQLVLVAGEAGIGKSTLIDRFVGRLGAARADHALGQCVEHYGSAEPYMPVLEALNMLCRAAGGAELVALMRRVAPTWLAQLPWFLDDADRQALQREVAGATQDRMLREFGELLDRCTAQRPLLLVLEDLHWSDHATVQLLGFLARRRSAAALMLLASFRPAEVIATEHPLAGLRQELRLHRLCREIDLEAFSEAEVGELLAQRLGVAAVPEPFVQALHAHTEGLPLYVVNLIDELIAEQALRREGDAWVFPEAADFGVPHHIVGVVEKQIARLPAEQQRLLGAASVAGVEFLHVPLAAVLQLPADTLREALDATVARQHWLRSTGAVALPDGRIAARYAFRHALYRHVFYQRLGLAQRMQWHGEIAAALIAAHGPATREVAAELALHFERGGQVAAAIRQLGVVAGRALARSAAREAVQAARHGLRLLAPLEPAPQQEAIELELRVLEGVALTRLHVFSDPAVAAAFERARALCERAGDSALRARALHGLWWVSYARCELAQARVLAQDILALARADGGDARLQLAGHTTLGITLAMTGELPESRRHLETALGLCATIGDELPPGLFVQHPGVEVRSYLAVVTWWMGLPGPARALAREAVALARAIRHPISQVIALHMSAVLHYFASEYREALATAGEVFEVIQRHGLPTRPGAFSWLHGHVVAALGDAPAGMAAMREAQRSCGELQMRVGLTGFHLHYAEACQEVGRLEDALATVDQGVAMAEAGPESFMLSPLLRVKAALLRERGDGDGAAACLHAALQAARVQGAGFHELRALVDACALPQFPPAELRARLQELLPAYADEEIAVVARARELAA